MPAEVLNDLRAYIEDSICIDKDDLEAYSNEELIFILHLERFMEITDKRITQMPRLHEDFMNLYGLAFVVQSFGGFEEVKLQKRWKEVAKQMNVVQIHVSTFKSLKHSYMRYIDPFLKHIHSTKLKCCRPFDRPKYQEFNKNIADYFVSVTPSEHVSEVEPSSISSTKKPKTVYSNFRTQQKVNYRRYQNSSSAETTSDESAYISEDLNVGAGPRRFSRPENQIPLDLKVGDRINVRYLGIRKLYQANIIEIKEKDENRKFYVHYLGWGDQYDEWIDESAIAGKVNLDDAETPVKRKRGRKPKSQQTRKPSPIPKEESSAEKKRTRLTYNSLQDEYIQAALENSLKEFQKTSTIIDEGSDHNAPQDKPPQEPIVSEKSLSDNSPEQQGKLKRKAESPIDEENNDSPKRARKPMSPPQIEWINSIKENRIKLAQYTSFIRRLCSGSNYRTKNILLAKTKNVLKYSRDIINHKISYIEDQLNGSS